MTTQRFKHDCDLCIFLGQYCEYDLYFCDRSTPTVIARYGNHPSQYLSGLRFATPESPELYEAKKRAIEKNLLKPL